MTSPALTLGSALLAFSPSVSVLILLVFPKPQLLILAICSAFAYLISALLSSALWWLFKLIPGLDGWRELLVLVLPSVLSQCIVRCGFVKMYFRVEDVIRKSVAKHEAETAAANSDGNNNNGHAETNALQLQMNDLSCSIASGAGYAFLHSLFLYGTLLASESGERYTPNSSNGSGRDGTLYQSSCSLLPSLVNGALISGMFSILDVIWMCAVFYGMRRRSMYNNQNGTIMSVMQGMSFVKGVPDSSKGGNAALGLVAVSHLAASLALAPNMNDEGCRISLPLLGSIVILVGIMFVKGVKGHYLPEDQRRRIGGMGEEDNVRNEHHVD